MKRERGCCQASGSGVGCGLTWEEKPTDYLRILLYHLSFSPREPRETILFISSPGDAGLVIDTGVTERIEGERCGELSLTTRPGQIIPIDIMHSDIDM